MMDGEAGYDGVEPPERGKRKLEVMVDDGNVGVVTEAFARRIEHWRREIERDTLGLRAVNAEESKQAAIAGAEVEDAADGSRDELEQDGFAFDAMGNFVREREVFERVFGGCVLV